MLRFIIDICFLVGRECDAGKLRHKKRTRINPKSLNLLVPLAGVEPARPYERGILSSPTLGFTGPSVIWINALDALLLLDLLHYLTLLKYSIKCLKPR